MSLAAATMGPPLSPRETRRSGRRSVPSASNSASKSPDSDPTPRQKEISSRPLLPSHNSGSRQRRLKQEDLEEIVDERKSGSVPSTTSTSSTNAATPSGRTKRKPKDKEKGKHTAPEPVPTDILEDLEEPPDPFEDEEQGITRCVCGSTGEDDPDAGEFMVQCETCKVWQHGLCMGFESEDQLHDDDYYCEECKPELHADLLKKRSKRPRQSSTNSHHTSGHSRVSRSHSPSTLLKQPSKRRNTMNSRDAAFDESLKEIIEATAAEAAAVHDTLSVTSGGNRDGQQAEEENEQGLNNRKKRKRLEDDSISKKRTRSASAASEHQSPIVRDDTKVQTQSAPAPVKPGRSNKRSGRKVVPTTLGVETLVVNDVEDAGILASSSKRSGGGSRARTSHTKRPPASHPTSHGSTTGEHVIRRVQNNGTSGQIAGPSTSEISRAYRNTHAYAVSQQPLYTSWNLPDYLAHLEPMLPTDFPQPLEVRSSAIPSSSGRGDSVDRTMERGVKVKWPGKRMSVGDMNKRVRSLVEWVGREQATAQERMRRKDALIKAFQEESKRRMSQTEEYRKFPDESESRTDNVIGATTTMPMLPPDDTQSSMTMKVMEELMEELIRFQEKFGPSVRNRDRERRSIVG